jgi:hypothetical protein
MSESDSLVRARHLQEWLAAVEEEQDPWRARFFAAIPPDMRSLIDNATKVAWLPAVFHVQLADILADSLGAVRAHAYYRRAFAASLRGPVLGPLVRTGMALLGLTPASAVRWTYKGWEASFRGCGSFRGEVLAPERGRLTFRDLPPFFCASDPWLDSVQASTYGVFDLLGFDGLVRIDKARRAEGGAQLELEWHARK